jgi:hypothetical protein
LEGVQKAWIFGMLMAVSFGVVGSAGAQEEPAELTAMRAKYIEAGKEILIPLKRSYGRVLEQKMKELIQAGKLEEAIMVKKEMEALASELMAGVEGPGRGKVINLMEMIDTEVDGKPAGKWLLAEGLLMCVKGSFVPKIVLPYEPPEEYDLTMTFEQPRLRNGVTFVVPNRKGGIFVIAAGGGGGSTAGLNANGLDGKFVTRKEGWFQPDKEYTLTAEIRKESVVGKVDGEEIFRYEGEPGDLRLEQMFFRMDNPKQLAISADDPTVFSKLELREVTGAGTMLREK